MILGYLFQRSQPAQGASDTTEVQHHNDDLLPLVLKASREFVLKVAVPSIGWIAGPSANDFFSKFSDRLKRVNENEPYPEVLTALADEVGRNTEADLDRLSEIGSQKLGAAVPFCDFYENLRPPSNAFISGKMRNLARLAWRANCPVIHAEAGDTSAILACINPLMGAEIRKHISRLPYAPLVSVVRLDRRQWEKAMNLVKENLQRVAE